MKNNTITILIVALVAAFIVLLLLPADNYVPYSAVNKYALYESMEDASSSLENELKTDEDKKKEDANVLPQSENFEPVEASHVISYSPLRDSEILDKFSQVTKNGMEGVNGCVSSGLSNSGGYICLTPELIQLLKTRGGNAAGGEILKPKEK